MKSAKRENKIFFLKKRVIFPNSISDIDLKKTPLSTDISIGEEIIFSPIRNIFTIWTHSYKYGSLCRILDKEEIKSQYKFKIKCTEIVKIKHISKNNMVSHLPILIDIPTNNYTMDKLKKKSQELLFLINIKESDQLIDLLNFSINPIQNINFVTDHFITKFSHRYKIYNCSSIEEKAKIVLKHITKIVKKLDKFSGKL